MNTGQLEEKLLLDPYTSEQFHGVYASNELPTVLKNRPSLLIVNTDPNYLPGKHWVVVYLDMQRSDEWPNAEYFDPLGSMTQWKVHRFLLDNSPTGYLRNSMPVQGGSSQFCGHFCLYYSYFRCRNFSMTCILQSLTPDETCNDLIVSNFVSQYME